MDAEIIVKLEEIIRIMKIFCVFVGFISGLLTVQIFSKGWNSK